IVRPRHRRPHTPTPSPYTTLFRSQGANASLDQEDAGLFVGRDGELGLRLRRRWQGRGRLRRRDDATHLRRRNRRRALQHVQYERSEERRVGKECRSWGPELTILGE